MIQEIDEKANKAKVTFLQFDQGFTIQYENKSAHQINPDTSISCGGGTDFDPTFDYVAQISATYIQSATIVFIFMTDGGSSYPKRGVDAMKQLQAQHPKKFKYTGIEFQSDADVMKEICAELKGTTCSASTS